MAWLTQGITSYIGGYVDQVVGGAMRASGGFAGDTVGAVGDGINSFGSDVEKSIRRYGNAAKDYGNAIKDWTDADGPRNPTASNPLGLSGSTTGGKRSLGWSAPVPRASSSPAYQTPSIGNQTAIKPSSSVRRLPAKISNSTSSPVSRKAPSLSKSSGAGNTAKKQGLSVGKSPTTGIKRDSVAGPTITKNQASAKKKQYRRV